MVIPFARVVGGFNHLYETARNEHGQVGWEDFVAFVKAAGAEGDDDIVSQIMSGDKNENMDISAWAPTSQASTFGNSYDHTFSLGDELDEWKEDGKTEEEIHAKFSEIAQGP